MPSKSFFKITVVCLVSGLIACQPKSEADKLKSLSRSYQSIASQPNPSDREERIKLAEFYYDFHDYRRAEELLEGLTDPRAKKLLAKTHTQLGNYDYAIAIFEKIEPVPRDSEYRYLYGRVLEEKNLFPKAIKIYASVEGEFKDKAARRLKEIKSVHTVNIPGYVSELSGAAEGFLSEVKDEAAIILSIDEKTEFTADDTSVTTIHLIEKILKERAKPLAEVDIGYDSTYQRVELEFARTINPDGKIVSVGSENIRDVSRYLNFPLYSNSRAFIISMPAVGVDSIIEYKLKIYSSKLIKKDNFSSIYRLREQYPILKAGYELIVPEKKKVNFKYFNLDYTNSVSLVPKEVIRDNKKFYSWGFSKIKPIIPEYSMPPLARVNPAVSISSFSDWREIYDWWKSLYEDKLKLPQATKDFAASLAKGQDSDFDKAKKIYEYVAKNIRYVAIEYGDSGYEPHKAQEVFLNRYGDCKDQAILLVSLLRSQGLAAFPVLIPTRGMYPIDKDFATVIFNHAIAVTRINGELIFMDPTSETTPFGEIPLDDQERDVLVFFEKAWEIITTPQIKGNLIDYAMDIDIDVGQNAQITRTVTTDGFFASSYRAYLKYTHPEAIEETIREKMASLASSGELISYQINNADDFDKSPQLTYKFLAEKFLNPAGNLRVTPVLDEAYLDHGLISRATRKFPIDLEGVYTKQALIRINLPENLKIKYLPGETSLDNPWFNLRVTYDKNGNTFNFRQKFETKQRFVPPEQYPEFKKELEDALYLLRSQVILEKI